MKALRRGSTGPGVRKLQTRLKKLGYYHGAIDSDFGPKTERALRDFQLGWNTKHPKARLKVDGVAGPITWGKLFPIASKIPFVARPARIIVLDIGHGMNNTAPGRMDPGAVSGSQHEHEWVERIVYALKARLEAMGRVVRVVHDQPVSKRDDIAAGFKPAILASNHMDSGGSGVMVLVSRFAGTWIVGVARRVAWAIHEATGLKLRGNRGVYFDTRGLAMFKAAPQRTILIEWAHITSALDRKALTDTKAADDTFDRAIEGVASVLAAIK